MTLYTQAQDAGYSAPGLGTLSDRTYYGGTVDVPVGDRLSVVGKADHREQDAGLTLDAAEPLSAAVARCVAFDRADDPLSLAIG